MHCTDSALASDACSAAFTGAVFYGSTLQWLTDLSVPGYSAMVMLETTLLAASVALIPAPDPGDGPAAGGRFPPRSWFSRPYSSDFPSEGSRSLASR